MINFFKKLILKFLFTNKKPFYNQYLYKTARVYVNFYDNNFNSDMFTNGEFNFVKNLISNNPIKRVFDAGANIGDYSKIVLKLNKNIQVHCFEPTDSCFEKLKKRFVANNVFLNKIALSDTIGLKKFYSSKESTTSNSFYDIKGNESEKQKQQISTTTIDDYCQKNSIKHIDLLKIDTEGHEFSILQGAKNMLKSSAVDIIQFEFGDAAIYAKISFWEIYNFLSKYNYQIYKIKPRQIQKINYSPVFERCGYANFLAFTKGLELKGVNLI